ncbi:Speckle-type POZ protein like [Argiope bruennichi]|uniref:Speckle-type POZ protein like n=1 Tax=Argiope bruennichi TaxID=94029 RepID=A0A8T0F6Q0_ARGBR|nr:Speckle-type POZ protein like [Argiope bruennichi]
MENGTERRLTDVNEVLVRRKVDYLPQDTLNVQCKIWKEEGSTQQVIEIAARTRIGTEEISFFHVIENFSKMTPNEKTIRIKPFKKNCEFSSSLHFMDEGKIMLEITSSDTVKIPTKCKLYLLGASEKKFECGETDNRFDAVRNDIQNLFLSLTRQEILDEKTKYLPEDKLFLSCEFVFSTGVEYEKIEKLQHKKPFVCLEQISNTVQKEDIFNAAQKLSACPSALDDLKSIYDSKLFADVNIKTKTKSFHVHKLLLCARSPVFKTMLTTDMKEKNCNSIQIEELEDDIVQQFLHFMYTDNLEDLQWESAIKLYYAGDKYEIEKLKIICSAFLVDNVTTSSASELLVLADKHNDTDLKKFVEDFIFKHEKEVFGSEEWEKLTENNAELVCKTMLLKYRRKM